MSSASNDRVLNPMPANFSAAANAIRALAMDGVQAAKSGHPGAPMGMAEMAVALWQRHLQHNPANPAWANRDRFVLSNGHASMLIYALLHLAGYDLPIKEIRNFRQLHSKTPGHPEVDVTPGVETTTGPLGQGLSNAVGMALAERQLAAEFNRPGHTIVDHHTYVFLGDGCLMEGISHESAALAGALRLNKLICLYDANGISIDGAVESWYVDDVRKRFEAYDWQVIGPVGGQDVDAIDKAIAEAKQTDRPVMIICASTIGAGSPARAGTAKAHGEPLGDEEIAATRKAIGWEAAPFEIPQAVRESWDARAAGQAREQQWQEVFAAYRGAHPELAMAFERRMRGELPDDFGRIAEQTRAAALSVDAPQATRKSSQLMLDVFGPALPELLGGSADLTGSNLTQFKGADAVRRDTPGGRHINYGVREFGMAGAMNGVALHGGYIPYGGTFLTFSDYSRNAIRMAALMKQRVIHVFTHDSIGLGEDGPTHQSVEHAASLRLIPGLDVWRPCDAIECGEAWIAAIASADRPSALLLTRQNVSQHQRDAATIAAIAQGAYVLSDREQAQAVLIASGSEVDLAIAAQQQLDGEGIAVRVVSMPCSSRFDRQDESYRKQVLGEGIARIGIEAGVTAFWGQYRCDAMVGIDSFGESAPGPALFEHFGFTTANVVRTVRSCLA